ncbi:hypothetical protein [Streptomyces sp. NPDC047525]|uniref:hypothetical protein n=1 Tax=Streptomyces sp. NPDC047525 TaxID=3155264 RepID=UPI0033D343EA
MAGGRSRRWLLTRGSDARSAGPRRLLRPGGRLLYAAAVVVGGVAVGLSQVWTTGAVAVGLAAALTAGVGLLTEHLRSLHQARVPRRKWSDHLAQVRRGRVPRVREVIDFGAWGVKHPRDRDRHAVPYVERDMDYQWRAALDGSGFVLVLGESTAGKTRAACEAVRRLLPDHAWVKPVSRDSVAVALDAVGTCSRCVLWLDDLEKYLGSGGLTESQVRRLLEHSRGEVVVVATLRSEEHRRYSAREGSRLTGAERDFWREECAVVALATVIRLDRLWSPTEIGRARELPPSRRLRLALQAADRFGISESLACGPDLVHEWRNAWTCGAHPRGAALVTAVLDCRRAGLHRPVPLGWSSLDHEPYLAARGGHLLRPEPFPEALAWACRPLSATSSLLAQDDRTEGLSCFDYLLGCEDLEPVPDHLWEALLPRLDPQEAYELGLIAHSELRLEHARSALRKACENHVPGAEFARALVIGDAGHPRQAMALLRALPGHDEHGSPTTDLQLSHFLGVAGEYDAAALSFRGLADEMGRSLGTDHPDTLAARHEAAYYTGEAGNTSAAISELTSLVSHRQRVLGAEHPQTFATRRSLAWFQGQSGQLDHATRELDTLLAEAQLTLGRRDPHVLAVRAAHAWFLGQSGAWGQAAQALAGVLDDRRSVLGPAHPHTLATRHQLAVATACSGDRGRAREQLRTLLMDMRSHLEPGHPHLLAARCALDSLA